MILAVSAVMERSRHAIPPLKSIDQIPDKFLRKAAPEAHSRFRELSYGTRFYSCAVPRNEQEHPLKQKARAMMPHSTRSLGEEKEAHDFFGKKHAFER